MIKVGQAVFGNNKATSTRSGGLVHFLDQHMLAICGVRHEWVSGVWDERNGPINAMAVCPVDISAVTCQACKTRLADLEIEKIASTPPLETP